MNLGDINVNKAVAMQSQAGKPAAQKFEEAVVDYSTSTGRTPPPKNDIKDGAALLQKGTLSIKDLAKNLFQSQNSQDIESLTQIVKQSGLLSEATSPPQGQTKPTNLNSPTNNKPAVSQENQMGAQNLNIVSTKVENQVLLGHIMNLIKTGSPKNAYEAASQETHLADTILESFSKQNHADQTQLRSMLGFISAMEANPGAHKPEILSQARRLYSKLQKELDELEEIEPHEDELSSEAQQFIGNLKGLSSQLKQLEGEWPSDLQASYDELLNLLEMGNHG